MVHESFGEILRHRLVAVAGSREKVNWRFGFRDNGIAIQLLVIRILIKLNG